ncbi:MAG: alpha/beta fold hydrolase, partial [Candidatus Sumerlaeota bacterium]
MQRAFDIPEKYYPFESRFFETPGGFLMHYLDEGEGAPLIMVHGNPTWSFFFRDLVCDLRHEHRCIVPDHIGCGLSDKPGDKDYEYTLSSRVDDLEALIESLDLGDKITLVLHDWGGMIGMSWAARHPERVARIVLMNTAAFRKPESKKIPLSLRLARTPLGTVLVRGFNAFSYCATKMCVNKTSLPEEISRLYRAPYNSWKNRIATLRFVQDIPLKEDDPAYATALKTEKALEGFRGKPTLMCWGLKDFVFGPHFLAEWLKFLPDADVHRWPEAG